MGVITAPVVSSGSMPAWMTAVSKSMVHFGLPDCPIAGLRHRLGGAHFKLSLLGPLSSYPSRPKKEPPGAWSGGSKATLRSLVSRMLLLLLLCLLSPEQQ